MAIAEQQLDNGVFRVTRFTIPPGDALPMHVHNYDYVVVPLGDHTMHVTNADGSHVVNEMKFGQSYARAAGAEHTVANGGDTTMTFVEIEKLTGAD